MICISCGKDTGSSESLCLECRLHSFGIRRDGRLEITVCPKCGALKIRKRWIYSGKKEAINSVASLLFSGKYRSLKFSVMTGEMNMDLKNGTTPSTVTVTNEGSEWQFSEEIPYHVQRESCTRCNRATGSYYEGVVQVRGLSATGGVILDGYVADLMKTIKDSASGPVRISKKTEGTDLYFIRYKNAEHFARRLSSSALSELTVTKKLSGRDNGLDLYRYTYLVRLFDVPRGGVVRHDGTDYIVLETKARSLTLISTSTGERVRMDPKAFYSSKNTVVSVKDLSEPYSVLYRSAGETHVVSQDGMSMLTIPGNYEGGRIKIVKYRNSVFPIPEEKIN